MCVCKCLFVLHQLVSPVKQRSMLSVEILLQTQACADLDCLLVLACSHLDTQTLRFSGRLSLPSNPLTSPNRLQTLRQRRGGTDFPLIYILCASSVLWEGDCVCMYEHFASENSLLYVFLLLMYVFVPSD